jgi:hypothetical protein
MGGGLGSCLWALHKLESALLFLYFFIAISSHLPLTVLSILKLVTILGTRE